MYVHIYYLMMEEPGFQRNQYFPKKRQDKYEVIRVCISYPSLIACILDVLWGQPIKLIQVVSTSEFHEY